MNISDHIPTECKPYQSTPSQSDWIDSLINLDTKHAIRQFANIFNKTQDVSQFESFDLSALIAADDAKSGIPPSSENPVYQNVYKLVCDRLNELADGSVEI